MYRSPSSLWLLPELGMDSRLLSPQADYFPSFESPPLPRYSADEDLAQYASRCVDHWLSDKTIAERAKHRFFLGGIGFGGLLAQEMALAFVSRSIQPAGVLLIGSARSKTNISTTFRLKLALLVRLPASLGRHRLTGVYRKLASEEAMSDSHLRILQDMARDIDWAMFRWQVQAQAGWKRSRSEIESNRIPIYQLHGRGDRIFRIPAVEDATILIHGKHLINLSLPGEVNRWIESILRDDDLRQSQRRVS